MKKAGNIVYRTHKYLEPYIKPGITTKELDSYVDYERNIRGNSNNTINKRIGALKTVSKYLASDNIKLFSTLLVK